MAYKGANVFIKGKRAPERRKRFLPRETTQAKAKNRLPSEKVALIERKGVLRAKTCLTKAKTPTNVARKVEKASTERSRYFYRT